MIIKNFSLLTIFSISVGVVMGLVASFALRAINKNNFEIMKQILKSNDFKEYIREYEIDQNKDDSILVSSFFAIH